MKPLRAASATSSGASSARKNAPFVVLVERHQRGEPPRHARVAGERTVLALGQLEPPLQLDQRQRERACAKSVQREMSCSVKSMAANRITAGQLFHDNAHALLTNVFQQEDLNFLLTNRIPRRLLTRFMGWFSKIEQPLVRDDRSRCGGSSPISI